MSSYTPEEIRLINSTTTEFYKTVADSFSSTRQHEWDGWRRSLPYLKDADTLIDIGCGNRRYSKFLKQNGINIETESYDNFAWDEKVQKLDIVESLLNDNLNLKSYDIAVCFGVMHHIPTAELRKKLLQELTKSKIAIVSFWQFAQDERIFGKAQETTLIAQEKLGIQNLEEGDYFLGWQDRSDVFRFCHNFTNAEVDSFASELNIVNAFTADKLNKYLIFSSN